MFPNTLQTRRVPLTVETRSPAVSEIATEKSESKSLPVLDFIASDETLDRFGEVICASGWHLETYRRNPVFQNAHQYGDILFTLGKALITEVRAGERVECGVGSAECGVRSAECGVRSAECGVRSAECGVGKTECGVGKTEWGTGAGQSRPTRFLPGAAVCASTPHSALRIPHLFQRIQFATDINPVARIAYGLYRGKFLNAVSVGFVPLRWEDGPGGSTEGKSARKVRRRYLEQELLEVSAVGIPANPNALALGLQAGAIEKGDLREVLAWLKALHAPAHSGPLPVAPAHLPLPRLLLFARELQRILRHA